MFGMGMSEILVILVVAVIFLGPDKLPEAAKQLSKGIRDIRKQTRELQQTIENDTQIGGAIREIKSALRGDELRRPPVRKPPPVVAKPELDAAAPPELAAPIPDAAADPLAEAAARVDAGEAAAAPAIAAPVVTLPPTAGEANPDLPANGDDAAELAALVRPAAGTAKREGHG